MCVCEREREIYLGTEELSTCVSAGVCATSVSRGEAGEEELKMQTPRGEACILATGWRSARVRTYVEINGFTRKDNWLFAV
jgi:hypothetical protein